MRIFADLFKVISVSQWERWSSKSGTRGRHDRNNYYSTYCCWSLCYTILYKLQYTRLLPPVVFVCFCKCLFNSCHLQLVTLCPCLWSFMKASIWPGITAPLGTLTKTNASPATNNSFAIWGSFKYREITGRNVETVWAILSHPLMSTHL